MGTCRGSVLTVAAIIAAATASQALADGVARVTPSVARPGQPVTILADGLFGPRPQRVAIPVYVVPIAKLPRPVRCQRDALCSRRTLNAPRRWPYTRVATLKRYNGGRVRFRLPRVPAGMYGFVLYCDVCWRGPGGTLIANVRGPRLRVVK
jgi:hypothetical protein